MIEEIKCTAWDCIGKYSELIDTSHLIKLKRSLYASANYRGGNTIRLDHIAWDKDDKLKIILCNNVYVIYNKKYGKVYIGQTRNLEERLNLHQEKQFVHSYTSRFDGEWVLIYTEHVLTRKDALIREKQLKSYQGRQFVRKYIPK